MAPLPDQLVDVVGCRPERDVLRARAFDGKGRRSIRGRGRAVRLREIPPRRRRPRYPPDLMQAAVGRTEVHVFGVSADAVVGSRIARGYRRTRLRGQVPSGDWRDAHPIELVQVPVGGTIDDLVCVVVRRVVRRRLARGLRRLREARQIVDADGARRPIEATDVPIIAAIDDDAHAARGIDIRTGLARGGWR